MTDNTMEYMTVSMCGADALDWCSGYNEAVTKANEIINFQNAKIESLEVSLQAMRNAANGFKSAYERAEGARNTAIQDFAERLKECTYDGGSHPTVWDEFACAVDNLVKEMIGEQE